MRAFTCPVCGGKLNIKIGTEFVVCDSCGNVMKIGPQEAERFGEIYRSAERAMRLNSVEGYEEALRQLDSISFIEEARKTRADCEKRLRDLQANLTQRQAPGSASESQNTSFAGVLLAVTLVFCAAAACADRCADPELKKPVQRLAEALRYADPVSSEATREAENTLRMYLIDLESAVDAADAGKIKSACAAMTSALADRNRLSKLGK